MAKIKIQGNASGTGVITLEAPNTNTDRAITLPDSAGELINIAPSSGNVLTSDGTDWTSAAGGADTSLSNLSATGENKVCQAWVNFQGTGTVAIRDSYNVSSVTDNSTGNYTVNFTNNINTTEYAAIVSSMKYWNGDASAADAGNVSSCLVSSWDANAGLTDNLRIYLTVFGD